MSRYLLDNFPSFLVNLFLSIDLICSATAFDSLSRPPMPFGIMTWLGDIFLVLLVIGTTTITWPYWLIELFETTTTGLVFLISWPIVGSRFTRYTSPCFIKLLDPPVPSWSQSQGAGIHRQGKPLLHTPQGLAFDSNFYTFC